MAKTIHTPSVVSSGVTDMASRYAMTRTQVESLLTEISTPAFFDNLTKLFSDPIDNLISLFCFPFNVKSLSSAWSGNDDSIIISIVTLNSQGKYLGQIPTPIFDLGTTTISRHFNNFLDFAPYTKIEIYLPFIGFEQLDVNVVMGKTLKIKYAVDLYTGKCTAFVIVSEENVDTLIMTRDGQCGMPVQLAGGNGAEISRNLIRLGVNVAGGAAGMLAGGSAGIAKSGAGLLGSTTVGALDAMKYTIHKGGHQEALLSGYAPTNAYLIYTRPVVAEPSSYAHSYGRPSGETATLSALTGYTIIDKVHVEGLGFGTATHEERNEIEKLLKMGVLL